ncbi:hypothetical protein WN944_005723 [Citrus x changshan-huyou]|uniref:Uncharacterized protein n=1 Tax=Citrus x changshan-huyou TaxID=2935761 RepID=A0AAP0MHT8_9ROSI
MLLQEEISILSDLSHKTGFKDDLDLEVAFVISDEEAIFKTLSKIVEFTRRDYCSDWSKLLWLSFS